MLTGGAADRQAKLMRAVVNALADARSHRVRPCSRPDMPKAQVDGSVDEAYEKAQRYLRLTRERSWVDHRKNVTLNEAFRVLGSAARVTEPILEWGERTHPSAKFEEDAPKDSGQV